MFYTALVYAMLRDSHGHQGQLHFTAGFPAFLIRFKIAYDTTHYDFHWKYWPVAYTQRIFFPGLCEYQLFLKKKKVAGVTSKRKCLRARRKFNWKKRGKERNKEGLQLALTWLAPRARLGIVSVSGLHCRTWSTPATFAQQEPILLCSPGTLSGGRTHAVLTQPWLWSSHFKGGGLLQKAAWDS